jgi:predicted transcriptional regulator
MPKVAELVDAQGISITFSGKQHERLKELAQKERRTVAYLVRVAVDKTYPPPPEQDSEPESIPA